MQNEYAIRSKNRLHTRFIFMQSYTFLTRYILPKNLANKKRGTATRNLSNCAPFSTSLERHAGRTFRSC